MEPLEANDVILLTRLRKVLFGTKLMNFTNLECKYGPQEDEQPADDVGNCMQQHVGKT